MPEASSSGPDEVARYRRARELFEAALQHPAAARHALVAAACGSDRVLLAEIEKLLAAEQASHPLLDGGARLPVALERLQEEVCASCKGKIAGFQRFCPCCGTPLGNSPHERDPRTVAGGRFRILAGLGRGGMGEVYRAQDLELGQEVALKFLRGFALDERARIRLRREVRLARGISHPNVCRVYDIGESEGDLYLSMEYVDGQDLATLLGRVGVLPAAQALEIARQLCLGLAAAHARSVLHRDLKPSNIMVDGRGQVRIMDFGVATAVTEAETADRTRGTPAYMAPEQLAGREASVQSDLYALGAVLHELFTGRPAFQDGNAVKERATPSGKAVDLDPQIQWIIRCCLQWDPQRRPESALVVAAALPGGDPLADALAAGQIPSPETVAGAGGVGRVSVRAAAACLAAIALGLAACVWMSRSTTLTGYVPLASSDRAMAERARAIVAGLGYTEPARDQAFGYEVDRAFLEHIRDTDRSPDRWDALRSDRVTGLEFWYRQSARPLTPRPDSPLGITRTDPLPTEPGMIELTLDPAGRLSGFVASPPAARTQPAVRAGADWEALFQRAGLDVASFTPVLPERVPPVFADERRAWDGRLPDRNHTPVRVEAAMLSGRPVYFEIVPSWRTDVAADPRPAVGIGMSALVLVLLAGSFFLARRNLTLRRADRRGAFRVAVAVGTAVLAVSILDGSHDLAELIPLQYTGFSTYIALGSALILWMLYLALEPAVRRWWPEMLIGWSRLVAGRVRDPLVGRDLLFGVGAGILQLLAYQLHLLIPAWLGSAPPIPTRDDLATHGLIESAHAFSVVTITFVDALYNGMLSAVLLALLAMLLRTRTGAAIAWVAIWTLVFPLLLPGDPLSDLGYGALVFIIGIAVLLRFGLLALVAHLIPYLLLQEIALRLDPAGPYAPSVYMVLGIVIGLALYGGYVALGRGPR